MTTPDIKDIDLRAEDYRAARDALSTVVAEMQTELDSIKHRYVPRLRQLVINAQDAESSLRNDIAAVPELFEKPRTRTLHGIKCGYQKGKASMVYDSADSVIKLIRKLLPEKSDLLIRISEQPAKKALEELDASTLKKLGIRIEGGSDQIVIKPTDSELDKLVDALLSSETEEEAA